MGKFSPRVYRKDSTNDHNHALPNGHITGGMVAKPSKDQYGWHSHLYEIDGNTFETTPAHDFGDHVHESELGTTSGPLAPGKMPGDPWSKTA